MSSFRPRFDPRFSGETFLVPRGETLACKCVGPLKLKAVAPKGDVPQNLRWVCPSSHIISSKLGTRRERPLSSWHWHSRA
jgi:hypothetical protein